MTDRRNPTTPDRRTRPGGRRLADPEPDHGTRARYQRGCTCTPCKAAEAAYRANLRVKHLKGLPVLGVLVSPVEARRRVRQLTGEGYTKARVAAMAGWQNGHLQFGAHERIRLATLLRIRRVAIFAMLEGAAPDPPPV